MDDTVILEFIEKDTKPLWPYWIPTDQELGAWIRKLRGFELNVLSRAVQDHYATREGSFKRPKLYAILELAGMYQAKTHQPAHPRREPHTTVFCQCSEHNNPIKPYQSFGVFVDCGFQDDPDYVMRAAQHMQERLEQVYGGEWRTIQGTNKGDLSRQMHEWRSRNLH